ncbi:amidase [Nocardioides massiliensis]|uniref:Amidase n=3 Tax=Nocardioides massiliensis TaxID=1325935 RepID=A0ABT9NJW2_9ACTN|nr:amidase [Nocardioides massiliensis]MDP9820529.1 amidase [Nocardioides massiliensis]
MPLPDDATALVEQVAGGERTAAAVLELSLDRIAQHDPALRAFSVVLADEARAEAAARDAELARGRARGPLHGVPVAVKEELDVAGCVTTFGGRGNRTSAAEDGEVVRRLRAAGAVIVGKTQMPEFGQWPFTESVAYGHTRNPWDLTRSPGGSSGGTAAAVAAGLVPVAIGGDGGGSIRIPAACCGIFGLKPQRGRVSSGPNAHLWWALGTVGPLSRTVRDSALVYDAIRGNAPTDVFTAADPAESFSAAADREPGRLRIGWSAKPVSLGVRPDPVNVQALRDTARLLADLGHDVREIDPAYPDPTAAFVPQFLGGVRAEAELVEDTRALERRTHQTLLMGRWATDKVVRGAIRRGEEVERKANRVFDDVDVLLTPTIACRPPRLGRLDGAGTVRAALRSMPMIAYTALWNVTGNPAASVPVGLGPDGLPLAVQLVGRTGDEGTLLSLSAQVEAAQPFPVPPLG